MSSRVAWFAANASLVALIFVCLAWELFLAPLKPGGSWLALKAVPLLAPLFGLLRGRRYTFQWSTLLICAYIAEGATRIYTDAGASARFAAIELALSLVFFASAIAYIRSLRAV